MWLRHILLKLISICKSARKVKSNFTYKIPKKIGSKFISGYFARIGTGPGFSCESDPDSVNIDPDQYSVTLHPLLFLWHMNIDIYLFFLNPNRIGKYL